MKPNLPVSLMVWTLPDAVIDNPALLEKQFNALREAGFDGASVWVRCTRYVWSDPIVHKALAHISRLAKGTGFRVWIGTDPRFISRRLIAHGGGARVLLFGDSSRASVFPHTAPISDGQFSIRCQLTPRHGHMFQEVALEYTPVRIERCYAVRSGKSPKGPRDIKDITASCHMFYNARDRYMEAFGQFAPPDGDNWMVLPFFHVESTHVDWSNPRQMRAYAEELRAVHASGVRTDSVMWDEPGYTCTYGSLPYTRVIYDLYRKATGRACERDLWKMAFDAADHSHIPVRVAFYRAIQDTMDEARRSTNRAMRKIWGPGTLSSIHDTWHSESADMCDMNHGSLDLWSNAKVKSGGFVDIGAANTYRDPSDPTCANLAAMNVIAGSLGRCTEDRFAYNNLWTQDDDNGEGWQTTVMSYCVDAMAVFGVRWMPHAYGPVGTIGQERTFLGSPPLPGYPDHSTWPGFPAWNARLTRHFAATGGALPETNVLLVFPLDTLYALADPRADDVAKKLYGLILALTDAHYAVHVLSPREAATGHWKGSTFVWRKSSFDAVILPYAAVIDPALLAVLRKNPSSTLVVGEMPGRTGRNVEARVRWKELFPGSKELIERMDAIGIPRPVRGPEHSWVSVVKHKSGLLASIAPSRHGYTYEGKLTCGTAGVSLPRSAGLTRVLFAASGETIIESDPA